VFLAQCQRLVNGCHLGRKGKLGPSIIILRKSNVKILKAAALRSCSGPLVPARRTTCCHRPDENVQQPPKLPATWTAACAAQPVPNGSANEIT